MEYILMHHISQNHFHPNRQSVKVLDQVNLTARRGEIVGILAADPTERAALMAILGCLCVPESGSYFLDSNPIPLESDKLLAAFRNYNIGFATERYPLDERNNVLENVRVPLYFSCKCAKKKMGVEAGKALTVFGMQNYAERVVWTLTQGEKVRVMLARAFVNHPKVMIGENILEGLNHNQAETVIDCINQIPAQGITTVLFMEREDAVECCDSVYQLKNGKLNRV